MKGLQLYLLPRSLPSLANAKIRVRVRVYYKCIIKAKTKPVRNDVPFYCYLSCLSSPWELVYSTVAAWEGQERFGGTTVGFGRHWHHPQELAEGASCFVLGEYRQTGAGLQTAAAAAAEAVAAAAVVAAAATAVAAAAAAAAWADLVGQVASSR